VNRESSWSLDLSKPKHSPSGASTTFKKVSGSVHWSAAALSRLGWITIWGKSFAVTGRPESLEQPKGNVHNGTDGSSGGGGRVAAGE